MTTEQWGQKERRSRKIEDMLLFPHGGTLDAVDHRGREIPLKLSRAFSRHFPFSSKFIPTTSRFIHSTSRFSGSHLIVSLFSTEQEQDQSLYTHHPQSSYVLLLL
jgi:hypothetical protein